MSDIESSEYRNTSTGHDGSEIIIILQNYLPENSSLLLLGIGSGRDLEQLSNYYNVTGSDFSKLLLSVYQKSHPDTDLITLDLIELETKRKFDGIYSNKVLHQMSEENLTESLQNQLKILNNGGLVMHSFWSGNEEEDHHGLKWVYYTEETLAKLIPVDFKIVELTTYKDKIDHDSIFMLLKKN
jgi:trans-aconitate methyltransferase